MTDTLALARAIYVARFADRPQQAYRRFDDLPAVAQAVWLRCADAADVMAAVHFALCEPPTQALGSPSLADGIQVTAQFG